jgi:lysozyme
MIDTIVDLNHANDIDFDKVKKAGILAIIHKASEGHGFRDPRYRDRRDTALSKGFLWGAYHFSSGDDVDDQVNNFLDVIQWGADKARDKNTFMALDWEPSSGGKDMTLAQARDFVTKIKAATKRFPVVYGGSLLRESVSATKPDTILANCPLWYARYAPTPKGIPTPTWPTYTLWQYTDGDSGDEPHTVPGMGASDRNRFQGTAADLAKQWPFT